MCQTTHTLSAPRLQSPTGIDFYQHIQCPPCPQAHKPHHTFGHKTSRHFQHRHIPSNVSPSTDNHQQPTNPSPSPLIPLETREVSLPTQGTEANEVADVDPAARMFAEQTKRILWPSTACPPPRTAVVVSRPTRPPAFVNVFGTRPGWAALCRWERCPPLKRPAPFWRFSLGLPVGRAVSALVLLSRARIFLLLRGAEVHPRTYFQCLRETGSIGSPLLCALCCPGEQF